MHGLQACLFEYITIAAFRIYAQRGQEMKMPLKRQSLEAIEFGGHALSSHGNYIVDHEKIMELCFEISVGTLIHGYTCC